MDKPFTRERISDGVYFSSVTDPKFKHNRITAALVLPLDEKMVSDRAIVPFLLRKGCASCPDFTQLNRRLCELYGASLSCDVSKLGESQILDLSIYGVDDRFTLGGEKMIEPCARLLTDIMLDPALSDGLFASDDVEIERQQLADAIESQINDKRVYALSRCKSAMCKGERIAIEKYGLLENAGKITPESATAAYHDLVKTAQIELIFVGCGDPEIAKKIFTQAFADAKRSYLPIEQVKTRTHAEQISEVTDRLEVSQGKLVLGFRTGELKDNRARTAMRVMSAVYGGTPSSRLFVYVREKLSLCYYCAARFDRLTGLMFVDSGVEIPNKQKAQDEILNQLEAMRRGEFTDEEVTAAKMLMQTGLKAVGDSLGGIEDWYMSQIIAGGCASPAEESVLVDQITREEIIAAANQVSLDTVYFLTKKEAE